MSWLVGFAPVADYLLALAVAPISAGVALGVDLIAPLVYLSGMLYRLLSRLSRV